MLSKTITQNHFIDGKTFQTPRLKPGEEEDDDGFWSRRKNGILAAYPALLAKVRQIVCAV